MSNQDDELQRALRDYAETGSLTSIKYVIRSRERAALEALLKVSCPATLHDHAKNEVNVVWVGDILRVIHEINKHGSSQYLAELQKGEA